MSFDWITFLNFSKSLQNRNDEATCRTIVSRSYYATFYRSRIFLESHFNYRRPLKDEHSAIISEMTQKTDPKIRKIGRDLKKLRGKRTEADYMDTASVNDRVAEAAILEAERIINDLMTYR